MKVSWLQRFWEEPGAHILLDPDCNVVEIGPEFARATFKRSQSMEGQNFFEAYTEPEGSNAGSIDVLHKAIEEAKASREPVKLSTLRFDMLDSSGIWNERWWLPTIIPICENGETKFIVIRLEDKTDLAVMRKALSKQSISSSVQYVLACMLFGVIVYFAVSNTNDLTAYKEKSCAIQRRALPAGRQQVLVLKDLYSLINLETSTSRIRIAKRQARTFHIPTRVLQQELRFSQSLKNHLALYEQFESKQPPTINC